jgi:serine/threonine protein kinase
MIPQDMLPGSKSVFLEGKADVRGEVSLPSEDLPEGTVSDSTSKERYTALGEIARGGMGAIVKMVDNDIGRPVAMKVILGGVGGSKQGEETARALRFVEEAQITGQLEHPNIVPLHELGITHEKKVYFTMKLVKGESLESILNRLSENDPQTLEEFPLPRLLRVYLKVCDAIAFAHSKGVIRARRTSPPRS